MHRFAIVVFLMVLFCAVASSFSATIHVPSQQPTIQAGINAAVNGDTVLVAPGGYSDNIDFKGKRLIVTSASGPVFTSITTGSAQPQIVRFVTGEPQGTEFSGFTLVCYNGVAQAILIANGAQPTISGCVFHSYALGDVVIRCESPYSLITKNVFCNNGGISCIGIYSGSSTILNNTFDRNARGFFSISGQGEARNNIVTNSINYGIAGNFSTLEYNNVFGNNPNYQSPAAPGVGSLQADPQYFYPPQVDYSLSIGSPCINAGDPANQYVDPDGSRNDMGAVWLARDRKALQVPQEFSTIQLAIDAAAHGDTILISPGVFTGTGNTNLSLNAKKIRIMGRESAQETIIDCSGLGFRTTRGLEITNCDTGTVIANLTFRNASEGILTGGKHPNLSDVVFENCTIGLYSPYPEQMAYLERCEFKDNSSGIRMGGERGETLVLNDCIFSDNQVGFDSYSGSAECKNTTYMRNGVGVYTGNFGPYLLMDSCVFDSNATAIHGSPKMQNSRILNSYNAIICPFFNQCSLTNVDISGTSNLVIDGYGQTISKEQLPVSSTSAIVLGPSAAIDLRGCRVTNNPGRILEVTVADVNVQSVYLEDCVFDNNGGGIYLGVHNPYFTMTRCQYTRNAQPIQIYFSTLGWGGVGNLSIRECTIAENAADGVKWVVDDYDGILYQPIDFSLNLVSANHGAGLHVVGATPDSAFNDIPVCNDVYGNFVGNYLGFSDPTGDRGNLSEDPIFCDAENGDFHVAYESSCNPDNNSCEVQIGVFGAACAFQPVVGAFDLKDENDSNVLSLTPEFSWLYTTPVPQAQDSFAIQVGIDTNWQLAECWTLGPVASSDTFTTYAGTQLVKGSTYFVRMQVHNGLYWSEWYQTSFRMNSVPTSPTLSAPTNLAVVGSTPILWVTNGTDAESDPLTYEFAGFHDTDCVAGPAIDLIGVASGVDSTGGQIVDPLAENCRYWWRARAFDGYEYSAWTSYAQFMVNGTPEAPATPSLDYPPLPDNKPIFTLLPTLSWQVSHDPDPGDTVRYKLELSDRANFSFALVRDSLLDVNLPLVDSLVFGTHYYWRVTAKDKSGLSAMSGVKEFWTWKLGDMNHSHSTDLSDLSLLIAYLTQTPRPDISPKMVADLTGDCRIDLSDLSTMVAFMTTTGVVLQVGCE